MKLLNVKVSFNSDCILADTFMSSTSPQRYPLFPLYFNWVCPKYDHNYLLYIPCVCLLLLQDIPENFYNVACNHKSYLKKISLQYAIV